jgi:hypothetical protein
MEADWEFEIGGDAPVIDACWAGFVDLRWTPESEHDLLARIQNLPEVDQFPGLALTLEKLNGQHSPVWTSKCDFWPALEAEDFDPAELDAPAGGSAHAVGCYIDLLPKSDEQWGSADKVAASCKDLCARLHAVPLRCCRVDLIIRRALIATDVWNTGITAYFTACGGTPAEEGLTLEATLGAFVDAILPQSTLQ